MKLLKRSYRVLVVGGGGREHAIVSKLHENESIKKLYCAPGNGGTAQYAENVAIGATDIDGLTHFAVKEKIDYVVVAPDDPLAMGLVDRLNALKIPAFGPVAAAAQIEASKSFAKDLMREAEIPTAAYEVFEDYDAAKAYLETCNLPIVLKADGLALGKGVLICETVEDALNGLDQIMRDKKFGSAGDRIVIEEFLRGDELTVLCFTDGKTYKTMPNSRDHKRALDGDKGLNTGGMGAVSPGCKLDAETERILHERIFEPTIKAMRERGTPFKGVLYFGLMLTADGPKVIEYNARFGDPETQTVLPLLETDLFEIFQAVTDERLDEIDIRWRDEASACVVMASGGYPEAYRKGYPITGLEQVDGYVFHAGTAVNEEGQLVTAGGRVLAVTCTAPTLEEALNKAYTQIEKINFQDAHYRHDIGRTGSALAEG